MWVQYVSWMEVLTFSNELVTTSCTGQQFSHANLLLLHYAAFPCRLWLLAWPLSWMEALLTFELITTRYVGLQFVNMKLLLLLYAATDLSLQAVAAGVAAQLDGGAHFHKGAHHH
jgi:hypothetical protein